MGVRSRSTAGGAVFGATTDNTVRKLTVPAAAMCGEVYVRTASLVYTTEGTDPTATAGKQADPHDIVMLNSRDECDKFEYIRQGGSDGTIDYEFFTDVSG